MATIRKVSGSMTRISLRPCMIHIPPDRINLNQRSRQRQAADVPRIARADSDREVDVCHRSGLLAADRGQRFSCACSPVRLALVPRALPVVLTGNLGLWSATFEPGTALRRVAGDFALGSSYFRTALASRLWFLHVLLAPLNCRVPGHRAARLSVRPGRCCGEQSSE